jgi:hypothetical protein
MFWCFSLYCIQRFSVHRTKATVSGYLYVYIFSLAASIIPFDRLINRCAHTIKRLTRSITITWCSRAQFLGNFLGQEPFEIFRRGLFEIEISGQRSFETVSDYPEMGADSTHKVRAFPLERILPFWCYVWRRGPLRFNTYIFIFRMECVNSTPFLSRSSCFFHL